jgi:hypothetical protein
MNPTVMPIEDELEPTPLGHRPGNQLSVIHAGRV